MYANYSSCACRVRSGFGYNESANDTLNVYKGSTLKIRIDLPFSMEGNTLSIVYSNKTALLTPEITVVDEDEGIVDIEWSGEQIDTLEIGNSNKIRFGVTFEDETQQNYNIIKINVI